MMYSSHEALVRRAVRDRQRSGWVSGAHWVVTAQVPPPKGSVGEMLRTSYGTWLRTTAVTGLASALLVPPAAAASPVGTANAPGIPATNPQAIRPLRPEAPKTAPRPQQLLMDLAEDRPLAKSDRNRHDDRSQVVPQLGRQSEKPVSPLQNPPPARLPSVADIPTGPASALAAPKPVIPPHPPALGRGLPPTPRPNRVDTERPQLPDQRPDGPSATPEERAWAAKSRPVTPERVDEWVTTVWTAMHGAPRRPTSDQTPLVLADVSPTPKMGWSYRVQRGDSLWRISTKLWADGSSDHSVERTWRMLYEWNRDVLGSNSNRIYPGQVLEIPADAVDVTTTLSGASPHPVAKDVAR